MNPATEVIEVVNLYCFECFMPVLFRLNASDSVPAHPHCPACGGTLKLTEAA